ncbi:hypothetical protein BJ875DRAFT_370642 [Amylocarpus encephaloides]|uniref:Uncharacterized protein n=1 Tax=Amylocarpus encephaloides TaxID=45428 RepID=A0A9P7YPP4_9HELO|nr:hypothetical protein BJ875DRAFT_370642 [Amylocarpus encephaloides]
MHRTPPKRRKLSPTTSIPINVPTTPSRAPVQDDGAQTSARRPSYAAPTQASISKHNPQLLRKPLLSGAGTASKGRNLDDSFARALGEGTPSNDEGSTAGERDRRPQSQGSITRSRDGSAALDRPTTPSANSFKSTGFLAKPRRLSRSPVKSPRKPQESTTNLDTGETNGKEAQENPFQKRSGLRRSPTSSQVDPPPVNSQENIGQIGTHPGISPFRKGALRRSPVMAIPQLVETAQDRDDRNDGPPETPNAPKVGPSRTPVLGPSQELFPPSDTIAQLGTHPGISPMRKGALRRSPVLGLSQPFLSVEQVEAEMEAQENRRVTVDPPQRSTRDVTPPLLDLSPEAQNELVGQSHNTSPEAPTPDIVPSRAQALEAIDQTELKQDNQLDNLMTSNDIPISPAIPNPEETSTVQAEESTDYRPPNVASPKKSSPLRSRRQAREPELPPTPSQLGIADPVMTTPPSGIHSTPSKRAKMNKALSEKLRSSPLKPHDPGLDKSSQERIPDRAPRRSTRFIVPPDPHASKKDARDQLLQELQQLQEDVSLANRENERIRAHHAAGKRITPEAPNADELLALLLRATEGSSEPKHMPASIFKSITSFLPFSSRRKTQDLEMLGLDKSLPSHLPIHMDDPLPYLRAFTPLTYTSTVTLLPAEQESPDPMTHEQPTFQNYSIRASHPSGLFAARISMVVNSSTLSIKEVSVPSLDLSAEKELGSFVRERGFQDNMSKDISVICWAMGRWTEAAIGRARLWCDIQEELSTPEAREKTLKRLTTRRKRKRVVEEDDDEGGGEETSKRPWTRRQLILNMGRTNMQISSVDVEILFEWKIGFDWTGEVENSISAHARLPPNWQREDDRNSLSKIPKTFQSLVKDKGPLAAAKAIVGLLMAPGDS